MIYCVWGELEMHPILNSCSLSSFLQLQQDDFQEESALESHHLGRFWVSHVTDHFPIDGLKPV